ncbi:hypothetical protein [Actinokineospora inagensis]|uniref:vWA-MoxR associated conflict system protein n=1 Tax=Actinokineospora inagensis TaxID=103730 RepID=UPI00041A0185|nr:hypothetical protein [Actinokineospora inagensis]
MTNLRPRHLLVLAAHSATALSPRGLDQVTTALTDVGGAVVTVGDSADAKTHVVTAARLAAGAKKVLLLAFLGDPRSDGDELDIPKLVSLAAQYTKVAVVLDGPTAAVDGVAIMTSTRPGFVLSMKLAEYLHAGIADGRSAFFFDDALAGRLDGEFTGLPVALGPNPAWTAEIDLLGPVGRSTLDKAVQGWDQHYPIPSAWTQERLTTLRAAAERSRDLIPARRVIKLCNQLDVAVSAVEYLREHFGADLSTEAMRLAGAKVGLTRALSFNGTQLLRSATEEAALAAAVGESPEVPVTRFLVALARELGISPRALDSWASQHNAEPELADAAAQAAKSPTSRRELRLVLSLACAAPLWPDEVDAWLLRPGEWPPPQYAFEAGRTQASVESAIWDAVHWASDHLRAGERLGSIDLAVPTHLLDTWTPERSRPHRFYFGARYQVLTQWAGWLDPDTHSPDLHDNAREVLARIAAARDGQPPVDPLDAAAVADLGLLDERLANGEFGRAIAIDHRPADLPGVLDLLLPYCPVLLWPRGDDPDGLTAVRDLWWQLPEGLATAYRDRSRLRGLRSVWHDEDWLVFGRRLARREINSPLAR